MDVTELEKKEFMKGNLCSIYMCSVMFRTPKMSVDLLMKYGQCSRFAHISHSILCKLILSLLSQLFSRNLVMNIKLYWYLSKKKYICLM